MDGKTDIHGMAGALIDNARDLERELEWFASLLDARLKTYFGKDMSRHVPEIPPPPLVESQSPWAQFIRQHEVPASVRAVIVLALIPHIRPQLLDVLWVRNDDTQRGFTEFGGIQSTSNGGFVPTGETAAFLLAGDDLAARFELMRLFDSDQLLVSKNVVHLGPLAGGAEPRLSGALVVSREFLHRVTTGVERKPTFSTEFPARLIHTELNWSELVLPASTLEQLEEIKRWVLYGDVLLGEWGMRHKLYPGFTCLFHGPPGTGKTLSACLLGKHCGCDVYKVDLSMIVSKYIGETEKNLARIFDMAEHKRWILFFDEADALFGKRTRVDDAHDRFANQEISFLLQRIEEFDGVVILASNFKANIDDAFLRRFHSIVQFPMPRQPERLRLWGEAFSPQSQLEERVDLARLAEKHDMTGGTIMNVVRYASLMALSRGGNTILLDDIHEGVRREFLKEGRSV
jgi:hypothetical protein